jgi:uncharacterized membrane protein YkoI
MTRKPHVYPLIALAALLAIAIPAATLAGSGGFGGNQNAASLAVNPADFSTTIDNPLFPLSQLGTKVFAGSETDPDTGMTISTDLTSVVTGETQTVAGVETLVLIESSFEDGELVEVARDYFAQHTDGTVYYFGEDVENYVNGVVDNTDGSWLAGVDGAEPGIIMPAAPVIDEEFSQENAPGVAEDKAKFIALGESISVTAGDFTGCGRTLDWNPLEAPDITFENKVYCPGVGLVFEEDVDGNASLALQSFTLVEPGGTGTPTPEPTPDPTADPTPDPSPVPALPVSDGGVEDDDAEDDDDGEDDDAEDDDGAPGQLTEGEELLPLAGITVQQAVDAALASAAGNGIQGDLGEVELEDEDGTLVFEVEVGDEEIEVDAQTGQVIPETDDEEDDDT